MPTWAGDEKGGARLVVAVGPVPTGGPEGHEIPKCVLFYTDFGGCEDLVGLRPTRGHGCRSYDRSAGGGWTVGVEVKDR